jgi:hypothetical protein
VISLDPVTGVEETEIFSTPLVRLEATPNPFTTSTDIRCQITDTRQDYEIGIYDVAGRLITDLSDRVSVIGYLLSVEWDGTDDAGSRLPGGIYFVRFGNKDHSTIEKILLIR